MKAFWWIAFAAISNGIGGTIRQTSWLGLLVIIPSTLWLLRGRRRVLLCGLISVGIGLVIIVSAMEWYKHQPLSIAEPLWRGSLTKDQIRNIARTMARTLFDALVFLLPVLLVFLPGVRWRDWRVAVAFLAGCVTIWGLLMLIQPQPGAWLEPSIGTYVSKHGVMDASGIDGSRPIILTEGTRIVLTALVIAGFSAMAVGLWENRTLRSRQSENALPWSSLWLLAGLFSAIYIALLMSRAGVNMVFDRYLFPLLFFLLLLITRYYQERVSLQVPRYAFGLLMIMAIYSIGATHDAFAMLRARLEAAQELQKRGVADREIDGGWEFNVWTVLRGSGALLPYDGDYSIPKTPNDPELVCKPSFSANTPGLHPRYALSYDPNGCGGQVGVPAVHYREWFGPREVTIYIVSSRREPMPLNGSLN